MRPRSQLGVYELHQQDAREILYQALRCPRCRCHGSSYGPVMASESTEPVFIESELELWFFKQFLVDDKVMTSFCDWVSFQNAEKKTHIKRVDYGYRYHGHGRSSVLSDAVR